MKIKSIDNDEFNIQFTVSNQCNYSCRYCPPKLNNGSTPLISTETYIRFFTDLINDNPEIELEQIINKFENIIDA